MHSRGPRISAILEISEPVSLLVNDILIGFHTLAKNGIGSHALAKEWHWFPYIGQIMALVSIDLGPTIL